MNRKAIEELQEVLDFIQDRDEEEDGNYLDNGAINEIESYIINKIKFLKVKECGGVNDEK